MITEGAGRWGRGELFAAIRRGERVEECSIGELADRYHVHRRTVRQAWASSAPHRARRRSGRRRGLRPLQVAIDGMLRSDLDAPKKHRHTARRVLARLVDEHGAQDMSYSTVRDYVAKRRPQSASEADKERAAPRRLATAAGATPPTGRVVG